jgi:UDP:flavonoid glycosyltransferase YjiC (YdhE family)
LASPVRFMPALGGLGRLRDRSAAAVALVFRSGIPALNQARAEFGLAALRDVPDLMSRANRILVCSSPSYDFAPGSVPANVCYVGPQLDDAASAAAGNPWAGLPARPLVLVGLGSTVMRQEGLLQRAADALGQLGVRELVTTGPAVDPAGIAARPDVTVTRWVRHADVLPHCSAVITHGGHGTVMKALIAGCRWSSCPSAATSRTMPPGWCTPARAPGCGKMPVPTRCARPPAG